MSCLVLVAVWPLWNLLGVMFGDGESLVAQGADQSRGTVHIPAVRGAILDRNGAELAISLPRVRLAANLANLARVARTQPDAQVRFTAAVASATGVSQTRLQELIDEAEPGDTWVDLVGEVTPEVADATRVALLDEGLLDALAAEDFSIRVHPAGESGLRLLGTVGPDGPGPWAGVERVLDDQLRGRDGIERFVKARGGGPIPGTEKVEAEAEPGATAWLTIDRSIQYEAERILMRGVEQAGAGGGVVVVGWPSTGELLAVASVDRDPGTGEVKLSDSPKAFADAYQAGSVFKVVTVASAIEHGVVDIETTLQVPDHVQIDDREFWDHDRHPTQAMTVKEILAQSSNVGTIAIARSLGAERLHGALEDFGFGARTGVASPAESAGVLPPLQRWTRPDLAASAIGTHQAATAVQLWSAYNVIANDGRYVPPRLIDHLERAGASQPSPEQGGSRRVISPTAAAAVQEGLRAVITEGTGKQWDVPGYPVAAKTGTSRMPAPDRVDQQDGYMWADGTYHYLAAFAGYLPADDPQVSITVLLEDVDQGLTGSTAAGPVFAELARLSIRELGVVPGASGTATSEAAGPLRAQPAAGAPSSGSDPRTSSSSSSSSTTTTTSAAPAGRVDDG